MDKEDEAYINNEILFSNEKIKSCFTEATWM